ncbi:hypothetical protein MOPEL_001_00010 [Mobilicoccus pelagius NBRC 104925]|uniref:Uncharacterized protein n=1 Tax=Mobilicoccus pelagius NBRC 104925 TaxID=1089455 RepID=H5UMC5_9MICO|nr:hypothetical protein MOPEL_001_00010 [Mobilicoccus pelagius NBRC 104925]
MVQVRAFTPAHDASWAGDRELTDDEGHQVSVTTREASAPENPDISVFVDDVHEALRRAMEARVDIVHPPIEEGTDAGIGDSRSHAA